MCGVRPESGSKLNRYTEAEVVKCIRSCWTTRRRRARRRPCPPWRKQEARSLRGPRLTQELAHRAQVRPSRMHVLVMCAEGKPWKCLAKQAPLKC